MLRFIYHSWSWIAGISAIIGIVTAFFTIKSLLLKAGPVILAQQASCALPLSC